jgi:hypothetical protein
MHLTLDLTQILQANKTLRPDGQNAPPRRNVMYPISPLHASPGNLMLSNPKLINPAAHVPVQVSQSPLGIGV